MWASKGVRCVDLKGHTHSVSVVKSNDTGELVLSARCVCDIGYWLLAAGCWPLAVGCWLLAVGGWLLANG